MGQYRIRDAFSVPGLLSLLRVPLAVCFPLFRGSLPACLAVLALAAVTDVLDGWYARRFDQVTPTGAALDPLTDKVFVLTVALTLVFSGDLSLGAVVLLSTREIGELPLVIWLLGSPSARALRSEQPAANLLGKVATALQFIAVGAVLFHAPEARVLIGITALVGAFAAASYFKRSVSLHRSKSAPPKDRR